MPKFNYKAVDAKKVVKKGQIDAKTKSDAKARLYKMYLTPLSIKIDKDSIPNDKDIKKTSFLGNFIYKDKNGDIQISLGSDKPTTKHLIVFTKQLSTMLNSGVPLIQSLNILGGQQQSRTFAQAIVKIRITVENGATLSDAMEAFPEIFDNLYIAMVRAGEASGNLDSILLKLVTYIEKADKIKSQVKSAMLYPMIVVFVAIIVISGLLLFVIPTFAQQFSDTGRQLPALTQWVIDFSNWFGENWYVVFGAFGAFVFAVKLWIKTDSGRAHFDAILLRLPGIGILLKKIAVGRFCSTMSSMLSSGVNLLEALTICAASSGNKVIESFITTVKDGIEKGQKLSEPLAVGGLFPDMVVSMVSVGEATGALDDMLEKVSIFYEEEVDIAVQAMLSMIEPIMIVVLGGIVGFLVIAMYLPIFDLAGGID